MPCRYPGSGIPAWFVGIQAHTWGVSQHALRQTPPCQQTATAAGGMHPTGIHSPLVKIFLTSVRVWSADIALRCVHGESNIIFSSTMSSEIDQRNSLSCSLLLGVTTHQGKEGIMLIDFN